jgi:putative tricarboxylic transport membrane protein
VGLAVLAVAALMVWGAMGIPADAGYAGVGPNFLPWVVAVALAICGVMLLVEVARGGFAHMPEPFGAAQGDWPALAWVAAGVVANAALIERIGFIVACAICYTLAVRGLRLAEGKGGGGLARLAKDFLTGLAISAPVFWLFTKVLAVNLPALTATGWL